jgi:hypothetical protein
MKHLDRVRAPVRGGQQDRRGTILKGDSVGQLIRRDGTPPHISWLVHIQAAPPHKKLSDGGVTLLRCRVERCGAVLCEQ